jgi:Integrase zinc binding domain
VLLRDIRKGIRETEPEDAISKAVKELKATSSRTVRSAEWGLDQGVLYFRGKIYVPEYLDLRRRIVSLCHDTRVAGHPGRWKTLELVSRNYWWPQMSRYIGKYTSTSGPPATCVFVPRLNGVSQSASSAHFRFRTLPGTPLASTSSLSFPSREDMTQRW